MTEPELVSTNSVSDDMLRTPSARLNPAREPTIRRSVAEYREFHDGEQIGGTRYRVIQLIGVGGMGTVYEVEHQELGKRFVLKALLRELARREDLVQRLRNEWRALGRLEHPSIVNVTDAGTSESGVPFYVMERLEGETLAQRMRRVRRFGVKDALAIIASVLDGLSAAHEIGVVHRDIKPPNIILVAGDRPKILDFGVAKIADDPGVVTARGVAVGTPRYMSPEQARGERVDGRADIYSSGLLLFEMIAGIGPFDDARDANELILAHIARIAPPLSSLAMGVLPELDAAVASMLHKDHERRPATAREAARALRAVLAQMDEVPKGKAALPAEIQPRAVVSVSCASGLRKDDTTRPEGTALPSSATRTSFSAPSWEDVSGATGAPRAVTSAPTAFEPMTTDGANTTLSSLGAVVTSIGDTVADAMPDLSATSGGSSAPVSASPVRTEILTTVPSPEASATHTRLPHVERPPSVTPPPIAPVSAPAPPLRQKRRASPARLGALGFLVLVGGGLGAVVLGAKYRPAASLEPSAAGDSEPVSFAAEPLVGAVDLRGSTLGPSAPQTARPVAPTLAPAPSTPVRTEAGVKRPALSSRGETTKRVPSAPTNSAKIKPSRSVEAEAGEGTRAKLSVASGAPVEARPQSVSRKPGGALPGSGL